jgi:Vitamin B6 photo-protection and homoeostasis
MASEPQKFRLLADIMNDMALLSDCLVPRVLAYRLPLLCFSGVSRALCGVMANAVGATMTAHFAKRGNLADVSAKSSSVGTVAQLVGTMVLVLGVRVDFRWGLYCCIERHRINLFG